MPARAPGAPLWASTGLPFNTPFSTTLRVLNREGQPWFIAKDVCTSLGMDTNNIRSNLYPAEVSLLKASDAAGIPNRGLLIVNEAGLYKLIMRSDKQEARKFQDWVTGVVLPAIRKDGGHILGEEKVATGEMDQDVLLARALQVAQRKLTSISRQRAICSVQLC